MNRREAIRAVMAMPGIAAISVAKLTPTDVIVLESDGCLDINTVERIKAIVETVWPGQKVVVLDGGLKLKIVRDGHQPAEGTTCTTNQRSRR